MAEPSISYAKKLVEIFLQGYNEEKKTNFVWVDSKSYQPKDRPYFDFVVFDGRKELGMQHTVAVADPTREYKLPKASEKIINQLQELLDANPNLPPLFIHINFHNPPTKEEEQKELVYWLEFIITHKVSSSLGVGYFSMDSSFDDQYLPRIKEHVNDLDIRPWKPKANNIVIGFGWSKDKPEPWPSDAKRIIQAVEKKERDCRDILLLVEAGWSPIHDAYREEIVDALSSKELQEVWVVEPFLNQERAVRLK